MLDPLPTARMTRPAARRTAAAALALLVGAGLTACTENAPSGDGGGAEGETDARKVAVDSSADACDLSAASAPAGTLTFDVTNTGDQVTEFYLLGEDGLTIVGEVENIGSQVSRQLVVNAPEGSYVTACKPGMKGEGIRGEFTVEPSSEKVAVSADEQELVSDAQTNYQAYVKDQVDQLVVRTQEFIDLYKAGDDDEARALYPVARTHWERIETVAESFGTLDPKMDAREADLEPGQKWTGWHRIEKDLWPQRAAKGYQPLTDKQRATYADDLMANTGKLNELVLAIEEFPIDQIANGSRGLLEEVATGKVTGEEEYWSRTDLWDFQANVDGAKVAFEGVRPILETKDPELGATLAQRFDELQALLDVQRAGDGFKTYDQLTKAEIREFATAVNALSEPLSKLTAAVLG